MPPTNVIHQPAYCVLWAFHPDLDPGIYTLCYNNGESVRTYYEGHLEPRAQIVPEDQFPRFRYPDNDEHDVWRWMSENIYSKCLVDTRIAAKILSDDTVFAEPV